MSFLRIIAQTNKTYLVFCLLMLVGFFNVFGYLQHYTLGFPLLRLQMFDLLILLIVGGHLLFILLSKKIFVQVPLHFLKYFLLYIVYTFFAILLLFRFPYHPAYGIFTFYVLFTYALLNILLFIDIKPLAINFELFNGFVKKVFQWVYTPVWLLALIQFLLKDDLITLNTGEKVVQVKSELMGTFRPRSLFNSSYEFGLFSTLIAVYFFPLIRKKTTLNTNALIFCIMGITGVLLCQTRNVYFICGFAIITIISIHKRWFNLKTLKTLPWFYVAIMFILLLYLGFQAVSGDVMSNLMSNESTLVRFSLLYSLFTELVLNGNMMDILFGWGLIQHMGDSNLGWLYPPIYNIDDGTLGIDNSFIAIFIHQGLLGLILYLTLYFKLLNYLISYIYKTQDHLVLFAVSMFITYPSAGVFNLVHFGFWGSLIWFFALVAMMKIYSLSEKNERMLSQI